MLIYEYRLNGTKQQYAAIDNAIRITQFIRNKCLRLWMDELGIGKNDLQCYCTTLAKEYSFATCLNSQARQASADRAWYAISRFYENCKNHKPGKKGYPKFQHDNLIAYEDLRIANMVKNHQLAKSIHDAAWGQFLSWMKYYAQVHGITVVAVSPHYTSQDCSGCGKRVQKTLSTRTHLCPRCGLVLDRDENAAVNILAKALDGTLGHRGTHERVS